MKRNIFLVFVMILIMSCCTLAAYWVQIDEKIYLHAFSLSPYNHHSNFDKDRLYSIWSKELNNGTEYWKNIEKKLGKKIWYDKTLNIVNCTKREIAKK